MNIRNIMFEIGTLIVVLALSGLAIWGVLQENSAYVIPAVAAIGLSIVAFSILRFTLNPDHLRAHQSHQILDIANETQTLLRKGFTQDSAQAVCKILLPSTNATAVALTDTEHILGFSGAGEDHHTVGSRIMTKATRETIEDGMPRVLLTKKEIGCLEPTCTLCAAVVVPLEVMDRTVGSLKLYYPAARALSETQVAVAEGLGQLLSTQLGLAELDRQAELATKSELRALQSQINPHFLFNTINTISALIRTDPAQARILLREFAVFYRRTLENSEDLIPLEKELEQTRRYLGFEIARFGDRITVDTDIDPDLEDIMVPAFVIQPIVENSINHAMIPDKPLSIHLNARSDGNDVYIDIIDDGVGIPAEVLPKLLESVYATGRDERTEPGMGIALKNVDDRLKGYFGPESGIAIESESNRGTKVILKMHDALKMSWR